MSIHRLFAARFRTNIFYRSDHIFELFLAQSVGILCNLRTSSFL